MNLVEAIAGPLDRERLPMWTIYDHPADHPDGFVGRVWYALPEPQALELSVKTATIEALRQLMIDAGYHNVGRQLEDDPSIVETWLI